MNLRSDFSSQIRRDLQGANSNLQTMGSWRMIRWPLGLRLNHLQVHPAHVLLLNHFFFIIEKGLLWRDSWNVLLCMIQTVILSFQTSKPLAVSTQPFKCLETTVRYSLGLQFCNENVLSFIHDIDRIEFHVPSTVLCTGTDGDLRSITSYQGITHL